MTRSLPAPGTRRLQSGIGMLEVLIAVLVISIGFLGMAALQASALSTNNSAMARSMATVASYSIIDAMRSDRVAAEAGNYNNLTPVNAANCTGIGTNNLAKAQVTQWCQQLGAALGAPSTHPTTGTIDCSATGICTVTIVFDDSRAGGSTAAGGNTAETITTVAQL